MVLTVSLTLSCAESYGSENVTIKGLQSVSQDEAKSWVKDQLKFINSSSVSMAKADDIAYFLENAFRERGYKEATVEWEIVGEKIVLSVREGSEMKLGQIDATGNTALEDEAIRELFTSATRQRMKLDLDDPIPFVATDVKQGEARVEEFYQLLGYGDVEVNVERIPRSTQTDLAVTIVEGTQQRVGTIELPEAPSPEITAEYEDILESFSEKTYSTAIPANLASRLRAVAVSAGYLNADFEAVEASREMLNDFETVNLVVSADWGPPVVLSGINVRGNEKVTDGFFENHFEELVDEPYSPDDANESVEELLQTGAFETIRTDLVEKEDGSFELDVDVDEDYSRQLGVYGGFTNYEGPVGGFEFRNLNLFGSVRKVDAEIEFSKRGARGEVEYTDPWFLESDWEFRAAIFAVNRAEEGYEKFQTGGRYEFTKRFGRQMSDALTFFGEASYTDVHEADIDPIFLGDREYFANSAGISLTIDRRDKPRNPRSGYIAQSSISVASSAIASETEFVKATGRLGYYLPFGKNTLRLGARAGVISPIGGDSSVPIDLRFFNGGANSVRSFEDRELGQLDSRGFPVGGEFFTTFNLEYEMPVKAFEGLSLVPFADAGNLLFDSEDASLDNMRYALGLGVRYETPIGPLRVEYGYNPDQQPGEPQGTVHVGFGFAY